MESPAHDNGVGDLCAELFRSPERLIKAHTILVGSSNRFAAHSHTDLLQIDLALGCGGGWLVNGVEVPISGPTIALFYPYEVHEYNLVAKQPKARFLSVKLQVDAAWPAIRTQVLGQYATEIQPVEPLVYAWQRLIWSYANSSTPPFTRIVRLTEVLWMLAQLTPIWPVSDGFPQTDSIVESAMHYIEQHIDRFVPLEELAATVHLSPRQLTRRFFATCHMSPHTYASKRRLHIATDMLMVRDTTVAEIAQSLGFSSIQSFSHWYKRRAGRSPDLLRRTAYLW